MAKTKTPFFGLGSQGSIGGTVTTQKRHQLTMVRTKPTPTYRKTLPQLYQRWLYEDYAYLWRQQTAAIKQQYATAGSHYHLTGFQYWMRIQLSLLPDIVVGSHLDAGTTTTAIDFSRNANHGTVFGASPIDGVIQRALLFDNINDYIVYPFIPAYDFEEAITLEAWVYPLGRPVGLEDIIAKKNAFYLCHNTDGRIRFTIYVVFPTPWSFSIGIIPLNSWSHVCLTWDGANYMFYLNGVADPPIPLAGTIQPRTEPISVGIAAVGAAPGHDRYFNGRIDNPHVLNRSLDATEVLRHSERRYPA